LPAGFFPAILGVTGAAYADDPRGMSECNGQGIPAARLAGQPAGSCRGVHDLGKDHPLATGSRRNERAGRVELPSRARGWLRHLLPDHLSLVELRVGRSSVEGRLTIEGPWGQAPRRRGAPGAARAGPVAPSRGGARTNESAMPGSPLT